VTFEGYFSYWKPIHDPNHETQSVYHIQSYVSAVFETYVSVTMFAAFISVSREPCFINNY